MNYTEQTLYSNILLDNLANKKMICEMLVESEFILACMETGIVSILEKNEIGNVWKELISQASDFIDNLIKSFREKSIKNCKQYVSWIKENREHLTKKAESNNKISVSPLWKGEYEKDVSIIKNAMNNAITTYSNQEINYDWASKLLKDVNLISSGDDVRKYLKNYFRFHIYETESKTVTLTSQEQVTLIPQFCDYIENYEKIIEKTVVPIQQIFHNSIQKLKPPATEKNLTEKPTEVSNVHKASKATKEAFAHSFFYIENKYACESSLNTLSNFGFLLEANEKPKEKEIEEDKKDSTEDNTNVKSVTNADTDKNVEDAKTQKKEVEKITGTPDKMLSFYKNILKFFKLIIASYITAMEERFISYINILSNINGGNLKSKDSNDKASQTEEKTQTESIRFRALSLLKN